MEGNSVCIVPKALLQKFFKSRYLGPCVLVMKNSFFVFYIYIYICNNFSLLQPFVIDWGIQYRGMVIKQS